MRCFECRSKCVTIYWHHDRILGSFDFKANTPITHVNSACTACEWQSFKTKLPDKIV